MREEIQMIKNDVAVIGIGLGGTKVGYEFQKRNYKTYLVNGSEQDNRTISGAKDILVLERYNGMAGDRTLPVFWMDSVMRRQD